MASNTTDLLPHDRVRALRRFYFARLSVVACAVLACAVLVHGVLLVPAYLSARQHERAQREMIAVLDQSLAGSEERAIQERVRALAEGATRLTQAAALPKAAPTIAAVAALPREGISLTGFSFSAQGETPSLSVSGIAASRESLRAFEQTLSTQPFIATVDLPIGAYARERDIDFTIVLSGPMLP